MASPDLVMYEEEYQQIKDTLQRLQVDSNARVVFLVDKNGQQIAAHLERERTGAAAGAADSEPAGPARFWRSPQLDRPIQSAHRMDWPGCCRQWYLTFIFSDSDHVCQNGSVGRPISRVRRTTHRVVQELYCYTHSLSASEVCGWRRQVQPDQIQPGRCCVPNVCWPVGSGVLRDGEVGLGSFQVVGNSCDD